MCVHACTPPLNAVRAADPTQETSGRSAECTALFIYFFAQMLLQLFSRPRAIYGPNALSSNMHDASVKGLTSPRLRLSGRIMWQRATTGKGAQIVQEWGLCVTVLVYFWRKSLGLRDPREAEDADEAGVRNVLKSAQGNLKWSSWVTRSGRIVCGDWVTNRTVAATCQLLSRLENKKPQRDRLRIQRHCFFHFNALLGFYKSTSEL